MENHLDNILFTLCDKLQALHLQQEVQIDLINNQQFINYPVMDLNCGPNTWQVIQNQKLSFLIAPMIQIKWIIYKNPKTVNFASIQVPTVFTTLSQYF